MKPYRLLSCTAILVGAGAAAQAAPVTSWNVAIQQSFADPLFIEGAAGTDAHLERGQDISWGAIGSNEQRSRLRLRNLAEERGFEIATVPTNGLSRRLGSLSHINHQTPAETATVQHVDISTLVRLAPSGRPDAGFELPIYDNYRLLVGDTPNFDDECRDGSDASGPRLCHDIVVIARSLQNIVFEFEDIFYRFELTDIGGAFGSLISEACNAAGTEGGCSGFVNPEGSVKHTYFSFRITSDALPPRPVPEPPVPGLVLLGLLGAAALRCRPALR